jgi:hypothetical protein
MIGGINIIVFLSGMGIAGCGMALYEWRKGEKFSFPTKVCLGALIAVLPILYYPLFASGFAIDIARLIENLKVFFVFIVLVGFLFSAVGLGLTLYELKGLGEDEDCPRINKRLLIFAPMFVITFLLKIFMPNIIAM